MSSRLIVRGSSETGLTDLAAGGVVYDFGRPQEQERPVAPLTLAAALSGERPFLTRLGPVRSASHRRGGQPCPA